MKTFDTAVLAVETATLISGYRVLDILTRENFHVLDASPCGDRRFLVFVSGEESRLKTALERLRVLEGMAADEIIDFALIAPIDRSVLESVFSLTKQKLEESLLIVEAATVSACLDVAQMSAKDHGLHPIEFRIRRSGAGGAYAVLTGNSRAVTLAAEEGRTHLRHDMRDAKIETIDQPAPSFRSLFEFSNV